MKSSWRRGTLYAMLWIAVAGYVVYSAVQARAYRRELVVRRVAVAVADSSARGHLITGERVLQELARAGIPTVGTPVREMPLAALEGTLAANGFVAGVCADVDYAGTLRIRVTQRLPLLRLLLDGYNAYVTAEGYVFTAPPQSSRYVPVVTGGYRPPFPPGYTGSVAEFLTRETATSEERIAAIEQEKYPLYRQKRELAEEERALRRMTISRRWWRRESKEDFARRVEELRAEKAARRRDIRYRGRVVDERIGRIDRRQEAEREKQKKLRKSCEDFLKLVNFVGILEEDDFWRSEVVQIVVSDGSAGDPQIELVPRAGSHTVLFGPPDDADEKLAKLLRFYRRGLRHVGWERYRTIDVRYREQVVCTK